MLVKQAMLAQQVQKQLAPLYILLGQDNYLLEESFTLIKSAIKKKYDCDEQIISLHSTEDWSRIPEAANSYSLFHDRTILNLFFDKKTLDASGKKVLTNYLSAINPRCFIILRAPNTPIKQFQWLSSHEQAVVSVAYPLNPAAMKAWIATQLRKRQFTFTPQVPELIHHYTQGNMLACTQVIEKISLSVSAPGKIELPQAQEHLSNQCNHDLFELTEACLLGQGSRAIQILRHAANNKTEATLVLWMLTQEIRTLIQLTHLLQQKTDIKSACSQLKIWPQRVTAYQAISSRFTPDTLRYLHRYCYTLDERLKSGLSIWNSLENLALSLCSGALTGDACNI